MLSAIEALLAAHNTPAVFTREHDVLVLAEPFSVIAHTGTWTGGHHERICQALQRHFLRSARIVQSDLATALRESCTTELRYRLTPAFGDDTMHIQAVPAVLLTCAPRAHLALATFLERSALFRAETIGRVTQACSFFEAEARDVHPIK